MELTDETKDVLEILLAEGPSVDQKINDLQNYLQHLRYAVGGRKKYYTPSEWAEADRIYQDRSVYDQYIKYSYDKLNNPYDDQI